MITPILVILAILSGGATLSSCTVVATRPVQEMSDTAAALKAAKEVQADTLAPELYRQSSEWFNKAKREYKFKNFHFAREYAQKARKFAEQAEFEAIRGGATRSEGPSDTQPPPAEPYDYPTPTGTPADAFQPEGNVSASPAPASTGAPGTLPPPGTPVQVPVPAPSGY